MKKTILALVMISGISENIQAQEIPNEVLVPRTVLVPKTTWEEKTVYDRYRVLLVPETQPIVREFVKPSKTKFKFKVKTRN